MRFEIEVWDWPLRAFHWMLVLAVGAAFITGELGGSAMEWHGRIGLFILGLLVFRLSWGFLGNEYARFASFFPTPARLGAYLQGGWQGHGHNPLGALSVFALLTLLAFQVGTGLFANDDIAFQGPLNAIVSESLGSKLTAWHHLVFNGLVGLIGLHLAAIVFHARIKNDNLLRPMITGKKALGNIPDAPISGFSLRRLFISVALAALSIWGVAGQPVSEPSAASQMSPEAAIPAW